jgi:hypothetical protein
MGEREVITPELSQGSDIDLSVMYQEHSAEAYSLGANDMAQSFTTSGANSTAR